MVIVFVISLYELPVRNGRNNFPRLKEQNDTIRLDITIDIVRTPTTIGAFFLNESIPARINENIIKGRIAPSNSLNVRLNV